MKRFGNFHISWQLAVSVAALACNATPSSQTDAEDTLALCQDNEDNDGDGNIDCEDADCAVFVACVEAGTGSEDDNIRSSDGDADTDAEHGRNQNPDAKRFERFRIGANHAPVCGHLEKRLHG